MKYQAVIFDLDGTLLFTLRDIADSTNTALRRMGFPTHEVDRYKYFVGDGRDQLAERALPENCRDYETITKLVTLINEEYERVWRNHSVPYPGVPELLDQLTASKIKMAVLSNKAHLFTEVMVKQILSRWHFNVITGVSKDVKTKPDPGAALQIARALNIAPARFIFLGDTDIDMKTANAAGMHPVGALWGFRTANELLAGGAKLLIAHPMELLKLF